MVWKVELSADAEQDFDLIFDHLFESYRAFGAAIETAFDQAAVRIEEIRISAESLANAPYRGTLHDEILPDLRHVTLDPALVWFELNLSSETVRILAIFFGGQDHVRHMLRRLLSR